MSSNAYSAKTNAANTSSAHARNHPLTCCMSNRNWAIPTNAKVLNRFRRKSVYCRLGPYVESLNQSIVRLANTMTEDMDRLFVMQNKQTIPNHDPRIARTTR